jgi:hypothetical protein
MRILSMINTDDGGNYTWLSDLVDRILSRCDDDPACIARGLESIEPDLRTEILVSDLLNAWQVFWYYFRADPGKEAVEFLTFHPAGELVHGVPMGDIDIYALEFRVRDGEPEIAISDDIQEVARYRGASAWNETCSFLSRGG